MSAVLFDLDGVLTPTAEIHSRAWKETFDAFLAQHRIDPPFGELDYLTFVDGKPRYDGVRSFLASRGIELPEGEPSDLPGDGSVCAIGNRKNAAFRRVLERDGIEPYPGSARLLDVLDTRCIPWAVVSSSKNATDVLEAAGLSNRAMAVVDGLVAAAEGLPGKPDAAIFERAAELLDLTPDRCAVIEDAIVGVEAGRSGGFGLVIGVARDVDPATLTAAGAHRVVEDLAELLGGAE